MEPSGQERGFTLVELIAVIAIITLFVLVAVPTIMGYRTRRGRDLGDAALILRSTLRTARTYAIQNRVLAGVFFYEDRDGKNRLIRRDYQVKYYDEQISGWTEPAGTLGKEKVLPETGENMNIWLDETADGTQVLGAAGHIFDPTGALDSPSVLKAIVTIFENPDRTSLEEIGADDIQILRGAGQAVDLEILRSTGRVRIRS